MKKFYAVVCLRQTRTVLSVMSMLLFFSLQSHSQGRPFGIVYSENMKGNVALFGNTLMNRVNADGTPDLTAMNGNSVNGNSAYDNGGLGTASMQYVDIDGNTGDGAGTRNSSSSDLVLPAGANTIKLARLYWGGRAVTSQFDMSMPSNQTIKVRKGTSGVYQEYAAIQFDRYVQNAGTATEFSLYQAYVDITSLVKQEGAGTYMVGNSACSTGPGGDFGNYGAWSIVVVYENPTLNFNSVRVFDGFQQIYNGGSAVTNSITLSGLNAPSGALAAGDAVLGIMGWEGDARYNGDFLQINGNTFSNGLNQSNNSWNGTITDNGVHVTTKNPNYTDQMGIDIDHFDVGIGYGVMPNASNVTLQFGTTQDQYFCGIATFVIRMKDPIIKLTKTVTDANNNGNAEAGEVLTYALKGKNTGVGNANAIVITDSILSTVTYVPGSLKVNYSPGLTAGAVTDAAGDDVAEYNEATRTVTFRAGNGANATTGGILALSDSFEVQFNVTVNAPAGGGKIPSIINVARLRAKSDALVDYVDDNTASINPVNAPLPVTLISLAASLQPNREVKLDWTTSMEVNSSHFDVERSVDGVSFTKVATKAAAGNSNVVTTYEIYDDIKSVTVPTVYYRLKQVDRDGNSKNSKVVSVRLGKAVSGFVVSPNPFHNTVNVNIEWDKSENTVLKVYNVAGAEVLSKSVKMINGNNSITIDELRTAAPGNYIIQFNSSNGKLIRQIVKEK